MNTRKFYPCACTAEGFLLMNIEDEHSVDLAIYRYGRMSFPFTWKDRIRWAWRIISKGDPWGDEILLPYDTARELAEDVLKLTESVPQKN
jgi:hypothetical protein